MQYSRSLAAKGGIHIGKVRRMGNQITSLDVLSPFRTWSAIGRELLIDRAMEWTGPRGGRLLPGIGTVAVVTLPEGPPVVARIVDIPTEALQIGLTVRFRPLIREDQIIVAFGPA